ncbi:MAG: magnetochrome domain-containing protein [Planctomycetota bacterium]
MSHSFWYRVLASLLAVACVALVVAATLTGGISRWQDAGLPDIEDLTVSSLLWPNTQIGQGGTSNTVVKRYPCAQCGAMVNWGSDGCALCGWRRRGLVSQVGLPTCPTGSLVAGTEVNAPMVPTPTASAALLPSPREQNAAGKEFIEGHWLGIEVIPLAPELAAEYRIPKGESGVLVDEITLEGAESGILAGDMIHSIDGRPTSDLRAFFLATQHVQEAERADVGISRRGSKMSFVVKARNTKIVGFAQMEAAQPIMPGAISPHRSRGRACTDCHIIMQSGGQLPTDAGDILPSPPPIAADAKAPHRDRGRCSSCHVIVG